MSGFDPWTGRLDDVDDASYRDPSPRSQLSQFLTAQHLMSRREQIERGTGFDVLDALAQCALRGLSIPEWLARLYIDRFNAVKYHRAGSWDDPQAFGRPVAKGMHLARLRKDREYEPRIYFAVKRILEEDPSRAIDELLFDDVAAVFGNVPGLGKTECARIYYQCRDRLDSIFNPDSTGDFSGKSRKIAVRRRRA